MITIRLIDARRGLHQQCESLFRDKKVADQIYWYLCAGLDECDEAEPERKKGEWIDMNTLTTMYMPRYKCSICDEWANKSNYCPNCGARMDREESKCSEK